jgi:hypothetical protein
MRKGVGLALAFAAALAGCKSLGFSETAEKDFSDKVTKPGTTLSSAGQSVKVVKFEQDFKANPPQVNITFRNEGSPIDIFSADVEFGYPAPAESFAPYLPEFVTVDIPDFQGNSEKAVPVPAPAGRKEVPLFARVVVNEGPQVRMTAGRESSSRGLRSGSVLLAGKVEVVKMEANLTPKEGEKPSLAFTLEHVDAFNPKAPIEGMRYIVLFFGRDGQLIDLGRRFYRPRPVGKNLASFGEQVRFEVSGLEEAGSLAGAQPVLRLTK